MAVAQNSDPEVTFREAQNAQQTGDYAAAAEKYQQLTMLHPELVSAHANLGVVLVQLGRYDEAIAQYNVALTQVPDNPALRLNLALAYYKKGDFAAAAAQFAGLNKEKPSDVRISTLLGNCELKIGLVDQAIALLQPLEASNPNNLDLVWALGTALLRKNQSLEGLKLIQRVADQAKNNVEAYQYAANISLGLTLFDEAKRDAEAVIRLKPDSPKAYVVLGMIDDYASDPKQAIQDYSKAIELDPKDVQARTQLTSALIRDKRYDDARKQAGQVLALDPNSTAAHYLVAQVEQAQGSWEAAAQQLETVVQQNPDWLLPHVQLSALYYRLKKPEDGAKEKAIVDRLREGEQKRRSETEEIHPQIPTQVINPDLPAKSPSPPH
jgi:tetratricopeptide (TPR) repeat protein